MNNGDQAAIPNALASVTNDGFLSTTGITKRELFAAMAMQGFCADPTNHQYFRDAGEAAESAVDIADALLVALERTR